MNHQNAKVEEIETAVEADATTETGIVDEVDTASDGTTALERLAEGEYDVILSYMGVDPGLRRMSPYLFAGYRVSYATVPDIKKREVEVTVARPGTEVKVPERTHIQSELEPEL